MRARRYAAGQLHYASWTNAPESPNSPARQANAALQEPWGSSVTQEHSQERPGARREGHSHEDDGEPDGLGGAVESMICHIPLTGSDAQELEQGGQKFF